MNKKLVELTVKFRLRGRGEDINRFAGTELASFSFSE